MAQTVAPEVEQAIRELTGMAKPSEAMIQELCLGWSKVFAYLGLASAEDQLAEFNDTMFGACTGWHHVRCGRRHP